MVGSSGSDYLSDSLNTVIADNKGPHRVSLPPLENREASLSSETTKISQNFPTGTLSEGKGRYQRRAFRKPEYNGVVAPRNDCGNLHRQYMWEEHELKNHVERLVNAKARVDCTPPRFDVRELFDVNRLREKGVRLKQLDEENRKMVQRLADVIAHKGSGIDCWNDWPPVIGYTRPDKEHAKKLEKIERDRQNSYLLEKLMAISPSYESHRLLLLEEYKRNVKLRDNMRRFPHFSCNQRHHSTVPSSENSLIKKGFLPKI